MLKPKASSFLRSALVFCACATSMQAAAQTEASNPQKKADNKRVLEEIIVTAQKKEEAIQDVPVSVTAIGGDEIELRGLDNLEEITKSVPNVITNSANLITKFYMRGMGTDGANFAPSVVTIIDGLPTNRPAAVWGAFQDLARIEILRGPQGTLFGKDTVAGVINIVSQAPTYEWSGKATVSIGDFGSKRYEGVLNTPLINDKMAMRLVYGQEETEGYMYNTLLDEKDGGYEKVNVGAKFLWDISENMAVRLDLGYAEDDYPNGYGYQATAISDDHRDLAENRDPDFETAVNRTSSKDLEEYTRSRYSSAKIKFDSSIGDYHLSFVSGYDDLVSDTYYDPDWGPLPGATIGIYNNGPMTNWFNELRLDSPDGLFNDRFEYIVGAYYGDTVTGSFVPLTLNILPGIGIPIPGLGTIPLPVDGEQVEEKIDIIAKLGVQSFGAFGQATIKLTDTWDVIIGLRSSTVKTEAIEFENRAYTGDVQVAGPLLTLGGYGNRVGNNDKRTDKSTDYKVSTRYYITEEIMTYATVATGYKAGGYGNRVEEDNSVETYNPEDSITYEIGIKADLFDGLARTNLTFFDTRFDQLQITGYDGFQSTLENAGTARSRGAELETQFVLPGGLFATFNAAYLNGRYVDYATAVCAVGDTENVQDDGDPTTTDTCDYSGGRLSYAPDWSASLLLSGEWDIGWGLMLNSGLDISYQDDVLFQTDNDPDDSQEAYTLYNASLGIRDVDNAWRLTAFMENITDERYLVAGGDLSIIEGHWGSMAPPKNMKIALSVSF